MVRFHRFWLFVMLSWIFFSLTACNLERVSTTTTSASNSIPTSTTTSAILENTGSVIIDGPLRYYSWSHDGSNIEQVKYFDAQFINIEYTPVLRMLCFDILINDSDYDRSEYYMQTRKRDTANIASHSRFRIHASTQTVHHCKEHDILDEIVLAKTSEADPSPSDSLNVMALLRVDDDFAGQRMYPSNFGTLQVNDSLPIVLGESTPYIDLKYELTDPNRLIESIRIEVYHRALDLVVTSLEILFTDDMFVNDTLRIDHIVFDELSPKTNFEVKLFVSGNDGVDPFESVYIASCSAASNFFINGSYIENSMPSLWGTILDFEVFEHTTSFAYYLVNDGRVQYQGNPLNVIIAVYDNEGRKVIEYPALPGFNAVEIDHQYLTEHHYLRMETSQNGLLLTQYPLNFGFMGSVEFFSYKNNRFSFFLNPTTIDIIWVEVSFKIDETGPLFFETKILDPEPGWYEYVVANATANSNQIYATYTVAFVGFTGYQTKTYTSMITTRK